MENISKDIFTILQYLLPGFISAWIFYSFTSYAKVSQFERIVEALIYTIFIQLFVFIVQNILLFIGKYKSFGIWNNYSELFFSILFAIIFGFVFSNYANNDKFHKFIRKFNISIKTSYPSEWFSAFHNNVTYIVLHLNDERRLFGWPIEWPSEPNNGHFLMTDASWLDDKKEIRLIGVQYILIKAADVKWIEFLEKPKENNNV